MSQWRKSIEISLVIVKSTQKKDCNVGLRWEKRSTDGGADVYYVTSVVQLYSFEFVLLYPEYAV